MFKCIPILKRDTKSIKVIMELQSKLKRVGFTGREAEVYTALLQRKEFTAPELTKMTTVTRTKIYEILQSLVRKGVCNESFKNGNKVFRAVKPKIALQNMIMNYEQVIEEKKKEFELKQKIEIEQKRKAADTLEKEIVTLYKNNRDSCDPLDYIEVITDIGQIRERWLKIQKNTRKELLVFTKPPYAIPPEKNIKFGSKVLKNKIICKSIYEYNGLQSTDEKHDLVKVINTFKKSGEEARIIKELPMKLVISDETVTMFALDDRLSMKPSITTMIVDHPHFASSLKNVFESFWSGAMTVEKFSENFIK